MSKTILLAMFSVCAWTMNAQTSDFVWVFLNTNPNRAELPKAEVDSLQAGHMANIGRLAKERKLLAAGPFYTGGGIFVFRRTTIDSVKSWVATDPAVKAGRFVLDFYPYRPVVGSICAVGDEYTMTTYTSVRLQARASVNGWDLVRAALATATAADTVISAGSFGNDGGFLVFQNPVEEKKFSSLAAVRDSSVTVAIKKLYIAKGSFCEP